MTPEKLTEQLQKIYGTILQSVICYGSAAGHDFDKKISNVNLLIMLEDISLHSLAKSASLCQKWVKRGNPMPLFVDRTHLEQSRDVFPIEFFDIKEVHRVLYGEDPFRDMEISPAHLRLQCESELKAKIIALRSEYLRLYPNTKRLGDLLLHSASAFFAIFRGLLRLKGQFAQGEPVPATRRDLLSQLHQKTRLNVTIFETILEIRKGKKKLEKSQVMGMMEDYLTSLERVSSYVNNI